MQRTEPHILVIFGASGDLTRRKLIPALYKLYSGKLLPEQFGILGIGRTSFNDGSYRDYIGETVSGTGNSEGNDNKGFLDRVHYLEMDPADESGYPHLETKLSELRKSYGIPGNYIFYLATPPSLYKTIPRYLHDFQMTSEKNGFWKRIIIEKPFGLDFGSARKLNEQLLSVLSEDQIYRIDHYLGKETVQNIFVTRFSNGIFEPLWNRNYIDHVEITSSEDFGVGSRGGYYDRSGALRDMFQNHLLQLVAIVAMEPPSSISSDNIRNEMLKVFQSVRLISKDEVEDNVIRGQYMEAHVRGELQRSYRNEQGVPPASRTETYVAVKLYIDNWRWGGVPFYVRTGKRMPAKVTEIVIHFKPSPHTLFCNEGKGYESSNQLIIRIQPNEGILLKFGMKVQGAGYNVQDVNMDFHYKDLMNAEIPKAYERLLLDCIQGDSTLYARGDAVEEAWKIVDPILQRWEDDQHFPLYGYPCGTWGPEQADSLIEGRKLTWSYPSKNLADDGIYCEL
ncbi:MAG: glucose-6-phosphate dehydrogenase [Bacteroidales bacterium]|nr:glucose-6-phosphate dehydrogenase [Bacteroidales bacterium]